MVALQRLLEPYGICEVCLISFYNQKLDNENKSLPDMMHLNCQLLMIRLEQILLYVVFDLLGIMHGIALIVSMIFLF